jgi:hypothetical protein
MRRTILGMAIAALLFAKKASADSHEGTLLAIDAGDLVFDIGRSAVRTNQVVELWRPVKLKHPVTGKIVTDRFKIATVKLTDVQAVMSLGRVEQGSQRHPEPGDILVVPEDAVPKPAIPAPGKDATPARPAATVTVVKPLPEQQELSELMTSLEGSDPPARISAYRAFVTEHPKSPYARTLSEEAEGLERADKRKPPVEIPYFVWAAPLDRMRPGVEQRYAVELDERFGGAVIHVRRHGATAYRSIALQSMGPRYWMAALPGDAIEDPSMDYFVEGVKQDGTVMPVVGTATSPRQVDVDARPLSGKREGTLATLSLSSEIASFNVKKANDWVFQTEGAFGWRLEDIGIRAVRSGFGVLRGKGGSLDELEKLHRDPRDVGLTYGWLEAEIGIAHRFSLIGRPILGLREGGMTGGAQGFFRIGNDLETNLLVGGEALGTVGLRGVVQLEWKTIPRVPILLRSEVTNQPAGVGGDIGARVIGQVGYEVVKNLAISARGSYQGRTINHAGPGAGAGVSYLW